MPKERKKTEEFEKNRSLASSKGKNSPEASYTKGLIVAFALRRISIEASAEPNGTHEHWAPSMTGCRGRRRRSRPTHSLSPTVLAHPVVGEEGLARRCSWSEKNGQPPPFSLSPTLVP
uniref:Uncharacterized protein n=1 Tax=Cannabis sativa TaxID=3483 RepID=A0A803R4Z4_CANSA